MTNLMSFESTPMARQDPPVNIEIPLIKPSYTPSIADINKLQSYKSSKRGSYYGGPISDSDSISISVKKPVKVLKKISEFDISIDDEYKEFKHLNIHYSGDVHKVILTHLKNFKSQKTKKKFLDYLVYLKERDNYDFEWYKRLKKSKKTILRFIDRLKKAVEQSKAAKEIALNIVKDVKHDVFESKKQFRRTVKLATTMIDKALNKYLDKDQVEFLKQRNASKIKQQAFKNAFFYATKKV